jgi:hypothetical protein
MADLGTALDKAQTAVSDGGRMNKEKKKRVRTAPLVNPDESKADKFRRLALKRVPRAVKILRQVANLASKNTYEYTDEQKAKIKAAISKAAEGVADAFDKTAAPADGFTL